MSEEGPRGWGAPLYAQALDLAGVGPGTRLLDLGCGPGLFARAAVDRGALVTGVDADPSAVVAAAAAVPEGSFQVGDAHDPPPGPFDVVAAVQLLAHVTNPVVVLRAAARVGAAVVVTVWGGEQECAVRAFGEALAPWLPSRPPRTGPPPITSVPRLLRLADLAGLSIGSVVEVVCPFRYTDAESMIAPLLSSGIGRAAAARAGERVVRTAVLDRLAPFRTESGGYRLDNLFRVLLAHPRA
ncbi:class I SAM-dependent methyltransferase [Pseudonocardia hispaniensis]|uniref:Class I SAM-dependent methyltransferase n=1 Tax=Pseudonocardia hispaniensis TaxID=904933 RepID=A0ABW1J669_9PSEU